MEHSLTGWDIANAADVDWAPWGARGDARAKLIASADGYNVVLVVAEPGYATDPHVHGIPRVRLCHRRNDARARSRARAR